MSYVDLTHAGRRPVQRTGLGVAAGPGMPVDTADKRPTLARSRLTGHAPYAEECVSGGRNHAWHMG
jgi:hypothetical protein